MNNQNSDKQKTYTVQYRCTNCDYEGKVTLKFGEEAKGSICPHCGCSTYSKVWSKHSTGHNVSYLRD